MALPTYAEPPRPEFAAAYDPATMSLLDYAEQLRAGMKGFDKFSEEALRTGPSTWAGLATDRQRIEEMMQREAGARQTRSGVTAGMSDLARRGGLRGGARERLAAGGAQNFLNMQQEAMRQGNINRLNIGMEDEKNRLDMLGKLPGMEMNLAQGMAQAKQSDVANAMSNVRDKNAFDMELYRERQKQIAGEREARAIESNK